MIEAPNMLLIGSAGRNAGKTELARLLIKKFRPNYEIVAVKVTTIQEPGGACPRGGEGCGACVSLDEGHCITQETEVGHKKDTQRLLAAGARNVFWVRVLKASLEEGAAALFKLVGSDVLIICESNSLRTVVEPAVFLMVRHRDTKRSKRSARNVQRHADRIVLSDGDRFDIDLDDIDVLNGEWLIRLNATAIVLAGGKSERTGQDKAMLSIGGRPMIEHVIAQLKPHFKQILLSVNAPNDYAFVNVETVPDKVLGQGPLMAIASVLEASPYDRNFVVACDIPNINLTVVRKMIRDSERYDAVIPITGKSHIEPLFAVYRKSILEPMKTTLNAGKRKIADTFELCRIKYMDIRDATWLKNINTQEEYEAFIAQSGFTMSSTRRVNEP